MTEHETLSLCVQCYSNAATIQDVCVECYRKTLPNAPEPQPDFEVKDGKPVFKDFESMKRYLAAQEKAQKKGGGAPKKSTSKRKGRAPVVTGTEEAAAAVANTPAEDVYMTLNFYMRPADAWNTVLKDAKDERGMRAPSTLVFAHNHAFGAACTDSCREVV